MKEYTYTNLKGETVTYYYRAGIKNLLIIHGYLQSKEVWINFLTQLPPEYGFLCPDLPGHGNSSQFDANYFTSYCETLKEIAKTHQLNALHLIGHSMGGYLTLHYARLFPSETISISLLHSTPLADTPLRLKNRKREIEVIKDGKLSIVLTSHFDQLFAPENREKFVETTELFKTLAKKTQKEAMIDAVISMANRGDYVDFCNKTTVPIQLLYGKHDLLLPLSRIEECVKTIPHLTYCLMTNSGHTCFIEETEHTLNTIQKMVDWVNKNG